MSEITVRPKCSSILFMVTPVWKWEFSIEAAPHYAYGALQRSEIPFANERLIMEENGFL